VITRPRFLASQAGARSDGQRNVAIGVASPFSGESVFSSGTDQFVRRCAYRQSPEHAMVSRVTTRWRLHQRADGILFFNAHRTLLLPSVCMVSLRS
jgi:hypothetical protein